MAIPTTNLMDDLLLATTRSSPLLRNLLLFGRLLRLIGLPVTSSQIGELAHSLDLIDIGRREDVKNTARCILVTRRDDIPLFDRAFDMFWSANRLERADDPLSRLVERLEQSRPNKPADAPRRGQGGTQRGRPGSELSEASSAAEDDGDGEGEETVLAVYSPGEVLARKDFAHFTGDELADAERFLAEMRWAVARRRSRRPRPAQRGKRLDMRRSLRRSLRHGGEMLDLARRGPKMKRRPLVLLCDISGSMDRYTRLLLHFLHSVERSAQRTEVFVFGTRLTRITHSLQRRDPDAAIAAAASHVQDWSGGTRIGEALRTFNRRWARRVMGQGAIVLIISDGWDRGDPELLANEMERLQRQSYRLLWMNPLLGSPGYQPLTQGMQAALPYVDDFLPVHNLASLHALADLLNRVQEGRPPRGQLGHRHQSAGATS